MRLLIAAVGRLRDQPEAALTADYIARAANAGRQIGIRGVDLVEVEGKPPGDMRAEGAALFRATPDDAQRILLDERGAEWTSRQFAERLARWRDDGVACTTFWIGGADGAPQSIKDNAAEKLAFGRQTWPHRLVRVMLAEQVYRALTILCGTPYHRD